MARKANQALGKLGQQLPARVETQQKLQEPARLAHGLPAGDGHPVTAGIDDSLHQVRGAHEVALPILPAAGVETPTATMLAALDPNDEPTTGPVDHRGEVNPHEVQQRPTVGVTVLLNRLQARAPRRTHHTIQPKRHTGANTTTQPSQVTGGRTTFGILGSPMCHCAETGA
jgi:hypothetical protein